FTITSPDPPPLPNHPPSCPRPRPPFPFDPLPAKRDSRPPPPLPQLHLVGRGWSGDERGASRGSNRTTGSGAEGSAAGHLHCRRLRGWLSVGPRVPPRVSKWLCPRASPVGRRAERSAGLDAG